MRSIIRIAMPAAAAGINVVVSSDAPYGLLNPWQVIHAATERRTREGKIIGADEGTPRRRRW